MLLILFQYTDTVVLDNYNPFPRSEFMKKFKVKLGTSMGGQSSTLGTPTPEECLLDLVNRQLKVGYDVYIHIVVLLWMTSWQHTYKVCVRIDIDGFGSNHILHFLECSWETKHWSKYLLILMCLVLSNWIFNRLLIRQFAWDFDTPCRLTISIYFSNKMSFRKKRVMRF